MLAKSLKSAIILAVALTFFGGTAMADRWERNCHQSAKWHHYQPKHNYKAHRHEHYRRPVYVAPSPPHYRQPQYHASSLNSLAPRIVIVGGLPIPVPPPPHVVLDYLTGH
jgi:hypothetical protein